MIFIEMQMLISWGVSGQNIYHSCTDSQTGGNFTHAACCFTNLSYSQIRSFAGSQISRSQRRYRCCGQFSFSGTPHKSTCQVESLHAIQTQWTNTGRRSSAHSTTFTFIMTHISFSLLPFHTYFAHTF